MSKHTVPPRPPVTAYHLLAIELAYTHSMASRSENELDAVSLFSNCGAGDFGFAKAGFRFRVMAELISSRLDVALGNHEHAVGVGGDLVQTWPDVVRTWKAHQVSSPALLAACPPCQGMSTARHDRGYQNDPEAGSREPRNLLVLPIAHVAEALKPTLVVVENVVAFLRRQVRDPDTGEGISAARLLIRKLQSHYEVYPFLTDLADYGVPQTRKRAFLTFVRRASSIGAKLRNANEAPYPVPPSAPDYGGVPVTLEAALADLDAAELDAKAPSSARDPANALHFVPTWSESRYRMVDVMPKGCEASAWDNEDCPTCGTVPVDSESAACPQCGAPLLRPVVLEDSKPRLIHGFRRAAYRRMDPKRPATTVTTASGRIGASSTIHPYQNRVLSPLECAHLQTIPDDFNWGKTMESRGVVELRAMIGEAVPPLFTRQHGEILATLLDPNHQEHPCIRATDKRCKVAQQRLDTPLKPRPQE